MDTLHSSVNNGKYLIVHRSCITVVVLPIVKWQSQRGNERNGNIWVNTLFDQSNRHYCLRGFHVLTSAGVHCREELVCSYCKAFVSLIKVTCAVSHVSSVCMYSRYNMFSSVPGHMYFWSCVENVSGLFYQHYWDKPVWPELVLLSRQKKKRKKKEHRCHVLQW